MQLTHIALISAVVAPACAITSPETIDLETAVSEIGGHHCTATKVEPGVFSTAADEGRLVFSLDGRDAYFHRVIPGLGERLFESHRSGGTWSTPTQVSFASGFTEFDPFISLDGNTLYYVSFRPVPGTVLPRGDGDLWKVSRTATGWGTPTYLADINTEAQEFFPSLTADGTLYFNSDRPGGPGAWDLYTARRQGAGFRTPTPLRGGVNTAIWEFNPSPSPLGTLLAFASLDPDPAAPYSDVFFAIRIGAEYSARVDAGPCVNTLGEEYHPTLDVARNRLIFVRRDPTDPTFNGDFYQVPLVGPLWSN
jgi:hypothetical protein